MMELNIQLFADGKVVIDTELNTKNFENGLDKMKDTSKNAGNTIKNIVAGLGIAKVVSFAMGQISASIDDAVKRVDTLNNFPKVMSNLGIASQDADKAIKKMSDKLAGLPTTLDQGASAVQRFTSANGDVKKSTDIFLSLNNAILAGGASSEIQASALEQLSQAYAKGKPDMMEWRTAMTAMPAQLKQVAQAMGYVSADELGEALRNGTVSMDDFMDTITKLNTEGVNGFQSFEQQAKNSTGGIGTAITVAKTQVVKGVADLIEGLNKGLKEADLPSISEIIANLGKKAKEVIDVIAKNLPNIIKTLKALAPVLTPIVAAIAAFKTVTTIVAIIKSVSAAMAVLNAVLLANPIGLIVAGIAALVAGFLVLWNKCEAFRNFWIGLWEGIKNVFNTVVEWLKENWKTALLFLVNPLAGIVKIIYDNFDKIKEVIGNVIQKIKDWFNELPEKIGEAIGLMIGNIIKFGLNVWNWTTTELPKIINGIIDWFAKLPDKIWEWLKQIPIKLAIMILNLINTAKTEIPKFINTFINFIKELPSKMGNIGKNIVEGLWNGIKNAKDWLLSKIKDFAKGITNGIKKALGIKSPSRVMRDEVGKYIAQGVGVGFEDELDNVYKDMQKAIDLETSKMTASVQTSGTYQMAMAGTPVFNLKDNSTNQTQLVVNGKVLAEVVNTENRNREVAKA